MGLSTIDPHSQNEHTKIHKIPKFGVNRVSFYRDAVILKCQNYPRNVWPSGRCVRTVTGPDGHTFLCKF